MSDTVVMTFDPTSESELAYNYCRHKRVPYTAVISQGGACACVHSRVACKLCIDFAYILHDTPVTIVFLISIRLTACHLLANWIEYVDYRDAVALTNYSSYTPHPSIVFN